MFITDNVPTYVRSICMGILILFAGTAYAGTNGKIMGKVVDTKGSPLPGVAVTISGTRLGASSDPDGRYFIMQVPPGVHSVQAQLIGYRVMRVTNLRVSADLTTKTDFTLSEEALKVGAMIVIAKRPEIEKDVTFSQTVMGADLADRLQMGSALSAASGFEPGASIGRQSSIRGGTSDQIRFQVDGIDRVDPLTNQANSQLNRFLVAEATVLVGGFNAEYGNLRSGVVNAVLKDGSERGPGLPWIAGSVSYNPVQPRYYGPKAYDSDQYDYWLMSSKSPFADTALTGALYWPDLYEETLADTAFMNEFKNMPSSRRATYKVFDGWLKRSQDARYAGLGKGMYGVRFWTPEATREAWEWEANMDERSWQYSHEPNVGLSLGMGWALPQKMGGILLGYTYSKSMNSVPSLIPYTKDQTIETKLTITPTDNLKLSMSYAFGKGKNTGNSTGAQEGVDPTYGSSINGTTKGDNKLNLSYSSPLTRDFMQWGTAMTYTFGPKTFMIGSASWGRNKWNMERDLPRVDITDFSSGYGPPRGFGYGSWLEQAFNWSDVDGDGAMDYPTSLADATAPGRVVLRSRYLVNVYSGVPTETKYIVNEVPFTDLRGIEDTIQVVSPQGWVESPYRDLSGIYGLGGGGNARLQGQASEVVIKGDLTHVIGDHTLKTGIEYIMTELEYHKEYSYGGLGRKEGAYRDYGGGWPTPEPTYLGVYIQDKFESEGMIANYGIRLERFNGGQNAYLMDDLFNTKVFGGAFGSDYFKRAAEEMGWNSSDWGPPLSYSQVKDSLGSAPHPGDVMNQLPYEGAKNHWCVSPRFGISHPVSDKAKFFFNFGQSYSKQKAQDMYGIHQRDNRLGGVGRLEYVYNPNLRPGKTTQYEVGVEQALPYKIVVAVRAYAKNAIDQSYRMRIDGFGFQRAYSTYRNADYQDLKGMEIRIARTSGRFVNGWCMYTKTSGGRGHVGFDYIHEDPMRNSIYTAYSAGETVTSGYNLTLVFTTPMEWGHAKGGWSAVVGQGYSVGADRVYNPNKLPDRELNDENYIPSVDSYSISFSFRKQFALPGRRSVEFGMSISNPLNTKRIGGLSGDAENDYVEYIYGQRQNGSNVKYGDKSTFFLLTRPYQTAEGVWKPPLAPRNEWSHHGGPRSVAFTAAISL